MFVAPEPEWRQLWDSHPYRAEFQDVPRGFVLEDQGNIVGSISNLWAKYWLGGRILRVAISGDAAVDPAYRSGSFKLMGETVRQPGVDLYLNGSPSEIASKIKDTLKVRRVPQRDYDVSLLWATRGFHVARAGLIRRGIPLAPVMAWPAGAAIRLASSMRALRARGPAYPVTVEHEFSEEFDALWLQIRDRSHALIGFRDRAMLQWRYGDLLARGGAHLLCVRHDGRLAGYAVLVRRDRPALEVTQYTIHDIQCIADDPGLTAALLRSALRKTRAAGLDLLEWIGHTGPKRALAEHCSALRYRLDVWQAYYYTRDPVLKQELAVPDRWAFGPYDSD
jgi:hypothetical protein